MVIAATIWSAILGADDDDGHHVGFTYAQTNIGNPIKFEGARQPRLGRWPSCIVARDALDRLKDEFAVLDPKHQAVHPYAHPERPSTHGGDEKGR